jgi:predicted membrane chloride channel (bestrophin family)
MMFIYCLLFLFSGYTTTSGMTKQFIFAPFTLPFVALGLFIGFLRWVFE